MPTPPSQAWPGSEVVRPAIERPEAMRLAATEYQRVVDAVLALRAEDWVRPTDCTDWTVRQLVAHIAGMAKFASSPLEMVRQMRAVKVRQQVGQASVDAQTAVQVEQREHLEVAELCAELRQVGPRAARGRRLTPGIVRRRRLPEPQVVNGHQETWSIGYLTDVILTRDPWMHRLDLARATGTAPTFTVDHDGVIIADTVLEWARRHGRPYRLELTGPAGGRWSTGTDGEQIVMDAADFCRVVSGRPGPDGLAAAGLLATQVPF
ncbi:MAG: maleylpyruvate isomerase family mycothiol-dependent enzyme [Aeromicrobium sp.]